MFVANANGCQVMCCWSVAEDHDLRKRIKITLTVIVISSRACLLDFDRRGALYLELPDQ